MQSRQLIAHLAFDLGLWHERSDRIDDDDVDAARAHQHVSDLEPLFAGIGLRNQQIADVDAELAGVDGVEGVFGVDIGRHTTLLLHLRDHLQAERRLAGRLRTVDFNHAAPRQAARPECDVEAERARGHDLQIILNLGLAHAHDRALAELLLDLRERGGQRFALVVVHGESCGRERHFGAFQWFGQRGNRRFYGISTMIMA